MNKIKLTNGQTDTHKKQNILTFKVYMYVHKLYTVGTRDANKKSISSVQKENKKKVGGNSKKKWALSIIHRTEWERILCEHRTYDIDNIYKYTLTQITMMTTIYNVRTYTHKGMGLVVYWVRGTRFGCTVFRSPSPRCRARGVMGCGGRGAPTATATALGTTR